MNANPDAGLLLCRKEGAVTHLTLNRPEKLNALNAELVEDLLGAIAQASNDGTRLLTLQGAGRNFSAGFDLSDFDQVSQGDLVLRFVRVEQMLQALHHAPFQTIAYAHGKNFGAGVDLICSCNRRIAASGSSFRMPGLRFGLLLGSRRFAQRVGVDTARDILLRSHQFGADEARSIGFIQQVVEADEWPQSMAAAVSDISALDREAISALLRVTLPDTRAEDMADLAISASAPGLRDRLAAYRAKG